ncbi:MAG: alpha-amylase family glycosyl hydrolase [Planctomycetota bacterium]|jgi:glycosidase
MRPLPKFPVLYEVNTWVWLSELSARAGTPVKLGDIPTDEIERIASLGFDGLWLMGVWTRSEAGRRIALEHPGLKGEYQRALPDYSPDDVVGSPYAVRAYQVDPALGTDVGLAWLRGRLAEFGMSLVLDFVPNHLAIDHEWVGDHPERFVSGNRRKSKSEPGNWFEPLGSVSGPVIAHGRDPNFPGWTDTAQLDYRNPETRQAMADLLQDVATRCDGVRADMAMLPLRDVFLRTWGGSFDPIRAEFWPAAITQLKARFPGFTTMAEAYWDLEWELQQMGFDFCYDKRLYDRLRRRDGEAVRFHLEAEETFQAGLVRFVENHDEDRAAGAFHSGRSRAAALTALTLPGMRLVHDGQIEGRRHRLPVQLARRSSEPREEELETFYRNLLSDLARPVFHDGEWSIVEPDGVHHDDRTAAHIVASLWIHGREQRLSVANLSAHPARAFLNLDLPLPHDGAWAFRDILGDERFERGARDLSDKGLFVELAGNGAQLFEIRRT